VITRDRNGIPSGKIRQPARRPNLPAAQLLMSTVPSPAPARRAASSNRSPREAYHIRVSETLNQPRGLLRTSRSSAQMCMPLGPVCNTMQTPLSSVHRRTTRSIPVPAFATTASSFSPLTPSKSNKTQACADGSHPAGTDTIRSEDNTSRHDEGFIAETESTFVGSQSLASSRKLLLASLETSEPDNVPRGALPRECIRLCAAYQAISSTRRVVLGPRLCLSLHIMTF
jgi:hypothetical protein